MADVKDVVEEGRLPDLSCTRSSDEVIIKIETYGAAWRLLPDGFMKELDRECEYHGEDHIRISPTAYDRLCAALIDAGGV